MFDYEDYDQVAKECYADSIERLNDTMGTAEVFEHPEDDTVVVRFSLQDQASYDYACEVFNEYVCSSGAPVIHCCHDNGADGPFVVIMERLEHLGDLGYVHIESLFSCNWCNTICDEGNEDGIAALIDRYNLTDDEAALLTEEFVDHFNWCIEEGWERGYSNDIHEFNVMIRTNNDGSEELVITDPWC